MHRSLPLCLLSFATLAACGVNELPQYRGQIERVTVSAMVLGDAELDVAEPAGVADPASPYGPGDRATESYVINALTQRMYSYLDPNALARGFADVFAPTVARGTGWTLVPAEPAADARILAEVDGYGISIDSLGHAEVYFRMTARAWFMADNRLIYQSWSSHRVPLMTYRYMPPVYGDDPDALAVERIYNLLELNDITGPELRALVQDAARSAAQVLARELVAANNY